jgi:hypothetical protein
MAICDTYREGALIFIIRAYFTSNKGPEEWGELIGDPWYYDSYIRPNHSPCRGHSLKWR